MCDVGFEAGTYDHVPGWTVLVIEKMLKEGGGEEQRVSEANGCK